MPDPKSDSLREITYIQVQILSTASIILILTKPINTNNQLRRINHGKSDGKSNIIN